MTTQLKLAEINTTAGTQIRVCLDEPTVAEYAEALRAGAQFPPIVVFENGIGHILADGFHRLTAAARAGMEEIEADVRTGTKSDALKYALGANVAHGLRRSNVDKHRSVALALAEWPARSDRWIAETCAVSDRFVNTVRAKSSGANGSHVVEKSQPATRMGMDGKTYPPKKVAPDPVSEAPEIKNEVPITEAGGLAPLFAQPLARLTEAQHTTLWQRADTQLKGELLYHLDLVRSDAQFLLEKQPGGCLEAAELKDCATELRFAAKTLETMIDHLIFLSEN